MEIYDDFNRLLFLHTHREPSALSNELPEESTQFRFLRASCLVNIKGSVGYRNPDVHIGIEIRMSTALATKIIIN